MLIWGALNVKHMETTRVSHKPPHVIERENVTDGLHYYPLPYACIFGDINIICYLVQRGADVNSTRGYWDQPMYNAMRYGHPIAVKYLLECGVNVEIRYVLDVINLGHDDVLEVSIKMHTPFNKLSTQGIHDDTRALERVLQLNCDINGVDLYGYTPLSHVCIKSSVPCMKLLLEHGADTRFKGPSHPYIHRVQLAITKGYYLFDNGLYHKCWNLLKMVKSGKPKNISINITTRMSVNIYAMRPLSIISKWSRC